MRVRLAGWGVDGCLPLFVSFLSSSVSCGACPLLQCAGGLFFHFSSFFFSKKVHVLHHHLVSNGIQSTTTRLHTVGTRHSCTGEFTHTASEIVKLQNSP
jgi:hypothetical protein